jgi:hypothetical protein
MLNGGVIEPVQARRDTFAGLLSIRRERPKYSQKWPHMNWKEIFGRYPPDDYDTIEPMNPSENLMWWIKRKAKDYRKMMQAREAAQHPAGDLPIVVPEPEEDWFR